MFVFGKIDKVGCGLGNHYRRFVGDLWAFGGFFAANKYAPTRFAKKSYNM